MAYRDELRMQSRTGAPLRWLLLAAVVVGVLLMAVLVREARSGLPAQLAALLTGRRSSFVSSGDVVEKIQRLNRLETAVYSLDTVVEGRESNAVLPDALAGDRLLMIVHGQTIAGIDFGKLKPESVQVSPGRDGRTVHIKLPQSEIFLTTIENNKTRVYTRNTGLFVSADPNLETATRLQAQGDLQTAAISDGILKTATANARDTVRVLLQGLGFTRVDVD